MTDDNAQSSLRWFKGNTHCHTSESDGDSSPETVIDWYKSRGYDFLCLSDHNGLTAPARFQSAQRNGFLLVPGEEMTDRCGNIPVHVNALRIAEGIPPQGGESITEVLQRNIDAALAAGGVPHVNHPSWHDAVHAPEMEPLKGVRLFEIFNGHPECQGHPLSGRPTDEDIWDYLLVRGHVLYGLAADDAHYLETWDASVANPGRGWVVVRASELSVPALIASLLAGDFYASTGVELEGLKSSPEGIDIHIRPQQQRTYSTVFIGKGGEELAQVDGLHASFQPRPEHIYVRARVTDSEGYCCWTQPVFPR